MTGKFFCPHFNITEDWLLVCSATDKLSVYLGITALFLVILAQIIVFIRVRRKGNAIPIALFTILAVFFLLPAILDPRLQRDSEVPKLHAVFAIDVSDSITQSDGGIQNSISIATKMLSAVVPDQTDANIESASVALFADGVQMIPERSVRETFTRLKSAYRQILPPSEDTNLEAALNAVVTEIQQLDKPSIVFLVSDGAQTKGNAVQAANNLGQLGVPVYILPRESTWKGKGILATFLPRELNVGQESWLRILVANPTEKEWRTKLTTYLDGQEYTVTEISLTPSEIKHVRVPVNFHEIGIRYMDASLQLENGVQTTRRFTTVRRKPLILSVSYSHEWSLALDPKEFDVIKRNPNDENLPGDYDTIVIDSVYAESLKPQWMETFLNDVVHTGLGLFVFNGEHIKSSEEPTVITSFARSSLGPVLPLSDAPRTQEVEPPGKKITIIIDTSGSMSGLPLQTAKDAAYTVLSAMRPNDALKIIAFSSGMQTLLSSSNFDESTKSRAQAVINGLSSGGGTNPAGTLEAAKGNGRGDCGIFFITDGFFGNSLRQPGCFTTTFLIGGSNPEVYKLGQVEFLALGSSPQNVKFEFFEPEIRDKYWEDGWYKPDNLTADTEWLPNFELEGNAISYAKDAAELIGVRPYPLDPVLAFMKAGRGVTGEYTSTLSRDWTDTKAGRSAITKWIKKLLAWSDREHYAIKIEQNGMRLKLEITTLAEPGTQPPPRKLSAYIQLMNGETLSIPLYSENGLAGIRSGELELTQEIAGKQSTLLLEDGEAGIQRIPFNIPSGSAVHTMNLSGEFWNDGANLPLLKEIADLTGGSMDPKNNCIHCQIKTFPESILLWPWLVVFGCLLYVSALAAEKFAKV
jgi:hypothetical protein